MFAVTRGSAIEALMRRHFRARVQFESSPSRPREGTMKESSSEPAVWLAGTVVFSASYPGRC